MGHWGVPSVTQALEDKTKINQVLATAFSITFTLYTILGVLCVLYFGDTTLPTVTLNWRHFSLSQGGDRPVWIQALSTAVVAVPVFTISCAIPMFIHTLANNILASVSKETWKALLCQTEDDEALTAEEVWPPYRLKVAARVFTLVPPFVLAMVERDASAIVSLCGLFGFVLMFFVPALLQWFSIGTFQRLWPHIKGVAHTPFDGWFSHRAVVVVLLSCSFVGFLFNAIAVVEKVFKIDVH